MRHLNTQQEEQTGEYNMTNNIRNVKDGGSSDLRDLITRNKFAVVECD